MVSQSTIDSLFAKPSDCGTHCFACGACAIFDFTLYPLMIYALFFNVPDFLKPPPGEEDARMFLMIKIGVLSAFTMVMCVYQIMYLDLAMQHFSRICRWLFRSRAKPARASENKFEVPSRATTAVAQQQFGLQDEPAAAPATDGYDVTAFLPGMVAKGTPEAHHSVAIAPQQISTAMGGDASITVDEVAALEEGVVGESIGTKKKKEGKRVKFC